MEDTRAMTTLPNRSGSACRRPLFGLLLLSLSGCSLSEYEGQMHKAQENWQHYDQENKFLDKAVIFPTVKDKDGHDVPIADEFFRPPKGIDATPEKQPRNGLMWEYRPGPKGSAFARVDLAFEQGDKDFVSRVASCYSRREQVPTPERKPPLPFDSWEYNDTPYSCSINIYKGGAQKVAVVFLFVKEKRESLRKSIELSLQSMADKTARQRYKQKSPWKLE